MMNFDKEEQYLRVLANAYITHRSHEWLALLPDDFCYNSMWVLDSITNKDRYQRYFSGKLITQKERIISTEFAMMRDKIGHYYLMITNSKTPEGGYGVFTLTLDEQGNIKRLDLTAAELYSLEPAYENNVIKRTYQTLLDNIPNCKVSFFTESNTKVEYFGVCPIRGLLDNFWGLANLDNIPEHFCFVYNWSDNVREATMSTPNTKIPVDFVFIDETNRVKKIHKNAKPLSKDVITCPDTAFAVELNSGQCDKNHISVGDLVEITI